MANEVALVTSRASVMVYDDQGKKWVACGQGQAIAKVQIFLNQATASYRIVGRKGPEQEVVINCTIPKGLKYNQATPTFHQWRDKGQVYGLNFTSKDEAEAFAQAMTSALDVLNMQMAPPDIASSGRVSGGQPNFQSQSSVYGGQAAGSVQIGYQQQQGYGGGDDSDNARLRTSQGDAYQEPWRGAQSQPVVSQQPLQQPAGWGSRSSQRDAGSGGVVAQPSVPEYVKPQQPVPAAPPAPPAPAAPPAPPAPPSAPPAPPAGGPPAPPPPPPPPPPPGMSAPAPPPMPPSFGAGGGGGGGGDDAPQAGSFAAALKAATLKKTQPPVEKGEDTLSAGRGPAAAAQPAAAPLAPAAGGNDLMSEMFRKLAARKAKEGSEQPTGDKDSMDSGPSATRQQQRPPPAFGSAANGVRAVPVQDSPKMQRSQSITSSQDVPSQSATLPRLKGRGSNAANTSTGASAVVNGNSSSIAAPTFSLGASAGTGSSAAMNNSDLEQLKQEILTEIRREMAQLKLEIIEGVRQVIRTELGH